MTERLAVIIPAAGVGKRMQADRPKQYLLLNDKPLLQHTLERLQSHPQISHIFLVLSADDAYANQWQWLDSPSITRVNGGSERVDSVLAGLQAARTAGFDALDWALVHDAARPCVTLDDIDKLLAARQLTTDGAILAYPVKDTMKRAKQVDKTVIDSTTDRDGLWHALTPQLFRLGELTHAIEQGLKHAVTITDEASAMEAAGFNVSLVEGCASNLKVTTPSDLSLAAFYLAQQAQ